MYVRCVILEIHGALLAAKDVQPEPLVGVFDASSPFQKDSLKPILKFTLHVSSATLKAARFPSQSTSCQRFDWITIQDILPIAEIFMNQIVFVVALLFHPKG